jgi:hypothetical protein
MAGPRAGDLSRHLLNEMAGHDGSAKACDSLWARGTTSFNSTLTLRTRGIHYRREAMNNSGEATATHGGTPWLKEHRF